MYNAELKYAFRTGTEDRKDAVQAFRNVEKGIVKFGTAAVLGCRIMLRNTIGYFKELV